MLTSFLSLLQVAIHHATGLIRLHDSQSGNLVGRFETSASSVIVRVVVGVIILVILLFQSIDTTPRILAHGCRPLFILASFKSGVESCYPHHEQRRKLEGNSSISLKLRCFSFSQACGVYWTTSAFLTLFPSCLLLVFRSCRCTIWQSLRHFTPRNHHQH